MSVAALADFGSTFTKVALVEETDGALLARAQEPTSIDTDLMDGYARALAAARAKLDPAPEIEAEIAASSAGGGLRVAAIGLVRDLTAAAARQAALNAGARVCSVVAGRMGPEERKELEREQPEIVLFAGGTEGGQAARVLENARVLASCEIDSFIIVACNGEVADEVATVLARAGHRVKVAPNVMPGLGQLEIGGAREAILRAFIEHVIRGKKLSARPDFERLVKMPTPEAVLRATELIARGVGSRSGVGDVMVVDIGGATTDVHSHRLTEPATPGVEGPLVTPPPSVRTVEGDLGLRTGAAGVVDVDGAWIGGEVGSGNRDEVELAAAARGARPSWVPADEDGRRFDRLLAVGCATHALNRHCGRLLLRRAATGPPRLVRTGPDLREVSRLIGTGGILAEAADPARILRAGLERREPRSLSPRDPDVTVDRSYILAAAGLLNARNPGAALNLMYEELAGVDG